MYVARKNGLRAGITALVAGLAISQYALAERKPDAETLTKKINVGALNLSSPAGAQEAYKRITLAAESICSTTMNGAQGVARLKEQRQTAQPCFDAAVKDALEQVRKQTGIDLTQVAKLDRNSLVAGR